MDESTSAENVFASCVVAVAVDILNAGQCVADSNLDSRNESIMITILGT